MSTSPDFSSRIAAGRQAVLSQVAFFHAQFGRAASHWKHDGSRVTDADLAISKAIFDQLRAQFPGDDLFSEELAVGENPFPRRGEWSWVLDPIDGTNNYALGIPVVAISLGLLRDGEPVYGFLYDIGRRTLFHGGPGQGVWADDERLQAVFGRSGRHERIIATHSPISEKYLPLATSILSDFKLRGFGSGALHLTYASLGMIDACMDFTVKVWDIAAATAIARESGARMHFWSASPFPLQQFDLKMKALQYCAGSPGAVAEMVARAERGWK
ncbi:MAG TPA: inositol monophosphatase [Opitutaceae bacterium]|nr:inositol monophosphatase [Opitutaceae bacterium]